VQSFGEITDVALAIAPNCKQEIVGIRPGEKIHEEMITASDSFNTYDIGKYYSIIPQVPQWSIDKYVKSFDGTKVPAGFCYNSGDNSEWLSVNQIRDLIKKHLDPNFN